MEVCGIRKFLRLVPGISAAGLFNGCITSGVDFEASAAAYLPVLRGDVTLTDSTGTGSDDVSVNSDLDLGDREVVPYGRASAGFVGFNLGLSGFQTSLSGSGNLSAQFGDIAANTAITTELDLFVAGATATFNLVDVGFLRIAPGLGVEFFDLELEVEDSITSITEKIDIEQPVPLAVLDLEIDPPKIPLVLAANLGGMVGFGDIEGLLLDGEVRLEYYFGDFVTLFGGYRILSVDVEGTDDGQDFEGDTKLSGFIVGAGIRF